VVWHTFGITHLPRLEDWPVMPCEYASFTVKPYNFFASNPGISLPPNVNAASMEVQLQMPSPGTEFVGGGRGFRVWGSGIGQASTWQSAAVVSRVAAGLVRIVDGVLESGA
jgi:Copper amine oxidase, enzyme domain